MIKPAKIITAQTTVYIKSLTQKNYKLFSLRLHCSLSYMINKFLHGERKLLSLCVWWYESIHEPSGIFVSQRLGRLQDNKLLPPLSQQYMKLHSMAWPRHFFSCICLRTHNGSHKLPVTSPLLKFIHCRHTNCGR